MQLISVNTTGKPTQKYDFPSDDRALAASLDATETGVSNDKSPTSTDHDNDTVLQPNGDREYVGVWSPGGILALPSIKIVLAIACIVQVRAFGQEAERGH